MLQVFLLPLLFCLILIAPSQAETPSETSRAAPEPAAEEAVIKPSLDERLRGVIESIERRQRELSELRRQRAKEPSPELDKAIEQTSKQISDLRQQFVGLATNDFTLLQAGVAPDLTINWQDELIQVIYPLLRELNALTAKPRQIEKLKMEISLQQTQSSALNAALARLESALAETHDRRVQRALAALQADLRERQIESEQKLTALTHQLEELERGSKPLLQSILSGARNFITSVGLHFGMAVALGLLAFYLIQLIGHLLLRGVRNDNELRLASIERLITFVIKAVGWLLGLFVYLMVLYALDSWVIFGLTVIVLIGAAFSLKNLLPDYLVEVRTLLNFGSIRQGERITFNGLPWRIAELDVYTTLHNPALDGLLRVPLTQISRLSSRPYHKEEPWFPSRTGDWVLLNDNTFGQIRLQTPDIVQLAFGESTIHYRTEHFLNARPQNLSGGFTVATTFGLDYQHQAEATTTILERLQAELEQRITEQEFGPHCLGIGVDFAGAGTSSLDYRLLATFTGAAADRYFRIQRWLQRCAVDSANRNGWVIPFPQVVVHRASGADAERLPKQPSTADTNDG
jgi:hypothetical protein